MKIFKGKNEFKVNVIAGAESDPNKADLVAGKVPYSQLDLLVGFRRFTQSVTPPVNPDVGDIWIQP